MREAFERGRRQLPLGAKSLTRSVAQPGHTVLLCRIWREGGWGCGARRRAHLGDPVVTTLSLGRSTRSTTLRRRHHTARRPPVQCNSLSNSLVPQFLLKPRAKGARPSLQSFGLIGTSHHAQVAVGCPLGMQGVESAARNCVCACDPACGGPHGDSRLGNPPALQKLPRLPHAH